MRILMSGATGMIGQAWLTHHAADIESGQYQVVALTRRVAYAQERQPNVEWISDIDCIQGMAPFDVVINLAGENLAAKRWTKNQKHRLCHSRWDITQDLVTSLKQMSHPPSVFLSGSAIGYYGAQGSDPISDLFDAEPEIPTNDFTHHLCQRWEALALNLVSPETRVCLMRTGVVLSRHDGALKKMLPAFKLGVGGPLGSGKQIFSWIHIDDMVRTIDFLIEQPLRGPVHVTAPNPISNNEFSLALAEALSKPAKIRTPCWSLKLLLGEMSEILINGQKIIPDKLLNSGFKFQHTTIKRALESLL